MESPNVIPLSKANLCVNCSTVTDSRGEVCVACGNAGSMLSLARILNPNPDLGNITYVYAQADA